MCNHIKSQVYGMRENRIFSPSPREANFGSAKHTYVG